MIKIIDSHTHLSFSNFDEDREEVIDKIKKQGIGCVEVGTTLETSRSAVELANKHDFIWAAVGVHPTEAPTDFPAEEFRALTQNPRVVAIGECGLDYYRKPYDEVAQKELFKKHIELAKEVGLPLVLHCREAHDDVLDMLKDNPGLAGTVHFFTGTLEQAKKYIEMGFCIGFDGPITLTCEYDNLIKELPLEKILIETDCPYAAPAPHRGKRNEPVYVVEVAKKIAEIKNISLDEVAEITTQNAKNLFNI